MFWELIFKITVGIDYIQSLEISISYISENCLAYIHSYHLYTYIFFIYIFIYMCSKTEAHMYGICLRRAEIS